MSNQQPLSSLIAVSSARILVEEKMKYSMANLIKKNGSSMKGLMDLFGVSLSDRINLQNTSNLNVQGNNLKVNTDKLLGLHGQVKSVQLRNSTIHMRFGSQPCR